MNLPFLRNFSLLGGSPTRQVVAGNSPAASQAAATLQALLAELPDLLLAAVLDVATGQPLATYATGRDYQPSLIAAPAVAVVRQLQAGLPTQGTVADELQEVLLTLPSQLHLLRLCAGGQQFVYLAVDARDTNLAIARQLMHQAVEQLDGPSR